MSAKQAINVYLYLLGVEAEDKLVDIGIQEEAKVQKYLNIIKVEVYTVIIFWNRNLKFQKIKKKKSSRKYQTFKNALIIQGEDVIHGTLQK